MTTVARAPSRLRISDVIKTGGGGFLTRKLRTVLSTIGVTIGIAAVVGVLGLSESSRADLLDEIDALGTNLLSVSPSAGLGFGSGELPVESPAMIGRIAPVSDVTYTVPIEATVRKTDRIPAGQTSGIRVVATDLNLLATLHGRVAAGTFLDVATAAYPNVVLGSVAAERLGISEPGTRVWIGEQWFSVVGILESIPLAPALDRAAIVGQEAAREYLGATSNPGTIYVRTSPDNIDDARSVIPRTANPLHPEEVQVTRPSDILEARAAAENAFTSLFLGLGAVALLVGGLGIANVMVIAVIERRNEIGLRRALGATKRHILYQFLTESLLLSAMGGALGVLTGAAATAAYATSQDWRIVLPWPVAAGAFGAALVIGILAGIYPATRAAQLAPTEALRSG